MASSLVPIVVGFLLTTVLGGLLGSYLQQRAWRNQNEQRLRDDELKRAATACVEVSQLLDKRLYRMLRLFHALASSGRDEEGFEHTVAARLADYDAVLYDWNDRLNVNLSLVGTSFGQAARDWLDRRVYEQFKQTGALLEQLVEQRSRNIGVMPNLNEVASDLAKLNDDVYRLGVFMMSRLREGHVGRTVKDPLPEEQLQL
jgi:hypothetical protein